MLILASQSPRRREILSKLGLPFEVRPSNEEEPPFSGSPRQYVMALAEHKAMPVLKRYPNDTIIAADTVVCVDDRVLGKPGDRAEAESFLRLLSGRSHTVCTGVALYHRGVIHRLCESTEVRFRPLTDALIKEYIDSGEPMDKAGAYGIQGIGGRFVSGIDGDFFNVMGLPLCALSRLMERLDIIPGGQGV